MIVACSTTSRPAMRDGAPSTGASALRPIDQSTLETLVATAAEKLLVPGAVVLPHTPQGAFTATYGTTRLGADSPPTAATHFRIASSTKTMTAAVILQLAEEGKLGLDDAVSQYVAGVPNGDDITIAQLLAMRSGLYNYTNAPEVSATIDRDPGKVWTPSELLAIAFAHPPSFAPGAEYDYCNTNYVLLGLVDEAPTANALMVKVLDRLYVDSPLAAAKE